MNGRILMLWLTMDECFHKQNVRCSNRNSFIRWTLDFTNSKRNQLYSLNESTYEYVAEIRQGTFAMFDYGMHGNILRYKQATSPIYNMSQYPTLMVSGEKDAFANTVDVAHLLRDIPPSPHLHTSIVPNFGHLDFVFGYSAHTFVYNSILTFFQQTKGL